MRARFNFTKFLGTFQTKSKCVRSLWENLNRLFGLCKHFALCRMLFENCLWPKKASRSIGDWTMSWNCLWDNKWDERGGGEAVFSPFLPCLNKRIPLLQSLKPHLSVSLQTVTDSYKWSTKRNSRLTRFFAVYYIVLFSKFAKSKIHILLFRKQLFVYNIDMGGIHNFISNTVTLQMKQNCQPRSEAKKSWK